MKITTRFSIKYLINYLALFLFTTFALISRVAKTSTRILLNSVSTDVIKRKSYPGFLKAIPVLLVLFFVFSNSLYADGTKQVSPGNGTGGANANGTAYFIYPLTPQGSYPGSLPQIKLKVTILDQI